MLLQSARYQNSIRAFSYLHTLVLSKEGKYLLRFAFFFLVDFHLLFFSFFFLCLSFFFSPSFSFFLFIFFIFLFCFSVSLSLSLPLSLSLSRSLSLFPFFLLFSVFRLSFFFPPSSLCLSILI